MLDQFLASAVSSLPLLFRMLDWIRPDKAKANRIDILKKLLNDKHFQGGRSFDELLRKTAMTGSPQACRDLLVEIGAEVIKLGDGREGYRWPAP